MPNNKIIFNRENVKDGKSFIDSALAYTNALFPDINFEFRGVNLLTGRLDISLITPSTKMTIANQIMTVIERGVTIYRTTPDSEKAYSFIEEQLNNIKNTNYSKDIDTSSDMDDTYNASILGQLLGIINSNNESLLEVSKKSMKEREKHFVEVFKQYLGTQKEQIEEKEEKKPSIFDEMLCEKCITKAIEQIKKYNPKIDKVVIVPIDQNRPILCKYVDKSDWDNIPLDIDSFISAVGENNAKHGFRDEKQDCTTFVSLIHSEVSEILEEFRKGKTATETYYREDGKPEGVPSELADVVIRCMDMANYYGIDLAGAMREKMKYNVTRPYKHGKKF